MRRYVAIIVAVVACISTASAWNKLGQTSIATLADQNLTPAAKEQTSKILGGDLASGAWWFAEHLKESKDRVMPKWQFLTLSADLKSVTDSDTDAVVQIERCAEVLRNRAEHSDSTVVASLKTLIHLVADMHNIGHIQIEGKALSRKNFKVNMSNGQLGAKEKLSSISWRRMWGASFIDRHSSFPPSLYALDLSLAHAADKANFEQGDPRQWAADMGNLAAPIYEWAKPDVYMSREHHNRLERLNDKCMARAGYRLAALLNAIFK